jgi:plastocyanin
MSTPEGQESVEPAAAKSGPSSWHKLASRSAFAIAGIFVLLMVAYMTFIPFFIPFIVIFGSVGWWVSRGGRASAIVLGILAILFLAINAPFLISTLAVPASLIDFVSNAWLLLAGVVAIVAGFAAARSAAAGGVSGLQRVVVGLGALALIVSIVAMVTYDEASQQDGDVELATTDVEFDPESLEADSGTVAVFVTNNDPTFHTFTIDELDVHLDIPANTTARVEFEADAGEYTFYCVPHEADMEGTLQVQ